VDRDLTDREEFGVIVAALIPRIYAYLRRLGVEATAAEDLTQDTFVAAWQNLPRLRNKARMSSWVYGIAYRHYLRHRESASRDGDVELTDQVPHEPGHHPEANHRLLLEAVRETVAALPDKYRDPVVLLYWEGLSYKEAAKALLIPLGTLAWRVRKALTLVRKALAEEGVWDEGSDKTLAKSS